MELTPKEGEGGISKIIFVKRSELAEFNLKEYYSKFDFLFLKEMLDKAVNEEDFELASVIRDVIDSKKTQ